MCIQTLGQLRAQVHNRPHAVPPVTNTVIGCGYLSMVKMLINTAGCGYWSMVKKNRLLGKWIRLGYNKLTSLMLHTLTYTTSAQHNIRYASKTLRLCHITSRQESTIVTLAPCFYSCPNRLYHRIFDNYLGTAVLRDKISI